MVFGVIVDSFPECTCGCSPEYTCVFFMFCRCNSHLVKLPVIFCYLQTSTNAIIFFPTALRSASTRPEATGVNAFQATHWTTTTVDAFQTVSRSRFYRGPLDESKSKLGKPI